MRITKLFDGCSRPTSLEVPLLSSAHMPRSGLLFEQDRCRNGFADSLVWPKVEIIMIASGSVWIEDHALKSDRRFLHAQDCITIWPADHESRSISWTCQPSLAATTEMISVQVDTSVLDPEAWSTRRKKIEMQASVRDPVLSSLMRLIEADLRAGNPAGQTYWDSLSLALTTHVLHRYGAPQAEESTPSNSGGLSKPQLERIRGFIDNNLGDDLSLRELARVAELSVQHFAASFKNSLGVTPHQYVLSQRIDEARRRLANGSMPIADMALALGFSSQSHFTEVFRRAVGVTPSRYRQRH